MTFMAGIVDESVSIFISPWPCRDDEIGSKRILSTEPDRVSLLRLPAPA